MKNLEYNNKFYFQIMIILMKKSDGDLILEHIKSKKNYFKKKNIY